MRHMTQFGYLFVSFITIVSPSLLAVEVGGNWIGEGISRFSLCENPANNHEITAALLFELDPPTIRFPDNFEIDFIGNDAKGTTNLAGIGSIDDATNIHGQLVGIRNGAGSFVYDFNGVFLDNDLLQITGSGTGLGCTYELQGLVERNFTIGHIDEIEGLAPELVDSIEILNDDVSFSRSAIQTKNSINSHLRAVLTGAEGNQVSQNSFSMGTSGLSAGDTGLTGLGLWTSYEHSNFKNTFIPTAYDGVTNHFLVGIDYAILDNLIVGLAVGYEKSNIDTTFNRGKVTSKGYSFSPYLGLLVDDTWGITLNAGYTKMTTDQFRMFGVTRIDSDTDGKRWFVSANFNATWQFNNFIFIANTGVIKAGNQDDAHTNSLGINIVSKSTQMSTLNIGAEMAYHLIQFEPYFSIDFNHNTHAATSTLVNSLQPSDDPNDILAGFGLRYYGDQGLSVNLEYSKRFKRDNLTENNFSVMGRWDF